MTYADFVLSVLSDGKPHSQADLLRRSFAERGMGLTVHSRVADLRKRGYIITCHRNPKSRRGDGYIYTLLVAASLPPAPVSSTLPPRVMGDNGGGIGAAGSEALARPGAETGYTAQPPRALPESEGASLTLFRDPPRKGAPAWA